MLKLFAMEPQIVLMVGVAMTLMTIGKKMMTDRIGDVSVQRLGERIKMVPCALITDYVFDP